MHKEPTSVSPLMVISLFAAALVIAVMFAGLNADDLSSWWGQNRPGGFSWSSFGHVDSNGDVAAGWLLVRRHRQEGNP